MLTHPITACGHGWPLDRVVGLIDDQLPSQSGVRLELMPVIDYPLVDLRCAGLPLHSVLDQVLGAAGWRWRGAGTIVTIDRPLPPGALAGMLALAASSDAAQRAVLVTRLADCGDLDACAALLASLSGPGLDVLDKSDPCAAEAAQRSVLQALSRVGGSWQCVVPRGNPLSLLATRPDAQQGLLASWQRCRRLGGRSPSSSGTSSASCTTPPWDRSCSTWSRIRTLCCREPDPMVPPTTRWSTACARGGSGRSAAWPTSRRVRSWMPAWQAPVLPNGRPWPGRWGSSGTPRYCRIWQPGPDRR